MATIIVSTVEILVISHHITGLYWHVRGCTGRLRDLSSKYSWQLASLQSFWGVLEHRGILCDRDAAVPRLDFGHGHDTVVGSPILHTFSGYAGFCRSTVSLIIMLYTAAKSFDFIESYSNLNTQRLLN